MKAHIRNHNFFVGALAFLCAILTAETSMRPALAAQEPVSMQSSGTSPLAPFASPRITQAINNSQLSPVGNNLRPEAVAALRTSNDLGLVDDSRALEHMLLLLRRSDAQEQALEQLITEQTTLDSPNYHNWLTAEQFGQYGLAPSDLNTITSWLESQGFTVNQVHTNGVVIDFSGNAGQVRQTFKTEIHHLNVNGAAHIANMSVPKIPTALSPAVAGIVSLNDFRPHTNFKAKPEYTFTSDSLTKHALVPADLATIYNLNPLFNAGINGAGQTIALIEDEDPYNTINGSNGDINTFRSSFGLPAFLIPGFHVYKPAGRPTYTEVHPNCADPGDLNDSFDLEVELDVEYAGAAAPYAALEMVSCGDSGTTFGGLIAMQNLLTNNDPARLWSLSYGECETENGALSNAAYATTYQQAAAAGISVFVSSGDEGTASCDADANYASQGITVSGFASTPYNVAVGGTDFGDTYDGTSSTHWNTTNTATYGSAKSYINEIAWNDSCASLLLALYNGFSTTYGANSFCNSPQGQIKDSVGDYIYITTIAGGGGPSGCATGAPVPGHKEVGGTCAGTPKPSWQAGLLGNPADGVRDLPDVSLFAGNGTWGHYWMVCYSNPGTGLDGAPCTGAPSGWVGIGGTSASSPIMAGIQALVNQKTQSSQGNPNPAYYLLANAEYGSSGNASCNASQGNAVSDACIFHDVTQGDIDVPCQVLGILGILHANDCYDQETTATYGVLSTTTASYAPAYETDIGWDFATGIGSVNAANLVNSWPIPLHLIPKKGG